MKAIGIFLTTLLASVALGLKLTMVVPPKDMRCVGEFIPKNEHMDFSYMLEDANRTVSMTVKIFNGTQVIKEIKDRTFESIIFKLEQTQALKMCVMNHMKEELVFPVQLKYGSDINDFSNLVTEVRNFVKREETQCSIEGRHRHPAN